MPIETRQTRTGVVRSSPRSASAAWACRERTALPTEREHRDGSCGSRVRRHHAGYSRFLRHGAQRAAPAERRSAARATAIFWRSVRRDARRRRAFVGIDTRPAAVKNFLAYTLKRLGADYVDLYQPTRVDPNVPIEETIGAVAEMVKAGYVRHIGISEASSATIRRAHAVHPIVALQIEYAIVSRAVEADILPTLRELGISLVAYGVFSRGLLTGHAPSPQSAAQGDIRAHFPRFQGENLRANQALIEGLRAIAQQKGISVAQLAVAWVLSRGKDIIPLVGARRRDQLAEALEALTISFSAEELAAIEKAAPIASVAGDRYGAEQMAALDSERAVTKSSTARNA